MKLEELKMVDDINIEIYLNNVLEIKETMEHPEWLGDFSKEDIRNLFEMGSKIWMFYDQDHFVCSMMFIPGVEKDLTRYDLDIDYHQLCDYGPMMVHPNYRGNHLQEQMLDFLNQYAKEHGFHYVISTVAPENSFSSNSFVRNGFDLYLVKEFKRGVRNVYMKKI